MKPLRTLILLIAIIGFVGFLGYRVELALPATPPLSNTATPITQAPPSAIGSYDVLGHSISQTEAADLRQTEAGQQQLSADNGAVEVTQELVNLGRQAFYAETFGGEVFQTEVVGSLDGPLNPIALTTAILKLGGKPTTNLQIPLDRDITIGDKTLAKGTILNTGLDVPKGAGLPLGMRTSLGNGHVRVGITCALCHATVDTQTGRVLEGAPNLDVNTGLLLAAASNSAALFRQVGVNPTQLPPGSHRYINAAGEEAVLPDPDAVETAVDAQLLSWPPGNFDSTGTMVNNPSQIPSSYTFEAWPYGWSGHSAIGWFHGLTTLNSNVHATNSDATTGADSSQKLLGIDKETYLGLILQRAANPRFRLPEGAKPSEFFDQVDPTPGEPAMNEVVRLPGYPKGSPFMLDGLLANSPGRPFAQELNAMSAWQNTLAPPPSPDPADPTILQRGAKIFTEAGCISCHSGRYFTNHAVISQDEVGTQPSRGPALNAMAQNFRKPQTYPPNTSVPLSADPFPLDVPTDITPAVAQQLAFGLNNPKGGYKVPSLIGLAVTAPYLHDGGVAAAADALTQSQEGDWYEVVQPDRLGMSGTLMQFVPPDPAASLRVLVDRTLREPMIAANQANPNLKTSQVDGSGHAYWVDREAGYEVADQTALIEFLLSLDDDPLVLPEENRSLESR